MPFIIHIKSQYNITKAHSSSHPFTQKLYFWIAYRKCLNSSTAFQAFLISTQLMSVPYAFIFVYYSPLWFKIFSLKYLHLSKLNNFCSQFISLFLLWVFFSWLCSKSSLKAIQFLKTSTSALLFIPFYDQISFTFTFSGFFWILLFLDCCGFHSVLCFGSWYFILHFSFHIHICVIYSLTKLKIFYITGLFLTIIRLK